VDQSISENLHKLKVTSNPYVTHTCLQSSSHL
jgi:hypothetical protein